MGDSLQKGIIKIRLTAATSDSIRQMLCQGLYEIIYSIVTSIVTNYYTNSIVTIIPIL